MPFPFGSAECRFSCGLPGPWAIFWIAPGFQRDLNVVYPIDRLRLDSCNRSPFLLERSPKPVDGAARWYVGKAVAYSGA
jgi:hypothetical protein